MTTIEGLYNFRDTGGMPLTGGGTTRAGVLFRSDGLGALTDKGLDQLAATDIGVIVDYRTDTERQMSPDKVPTSRPFKEVVLPILQGATAGAMKAAAEAAMHAADKSASSAAIQKALEQLPDLSTLYQGILSEGASAYAETARLVAQSTDAEPTAVLIHCTAGKDRTGVGAALLLTAAGAERDAVVADYASSQDNLAKGWSQHMLGMIKSMGVEPTPGLVEMATGTPPEAIEAALAWVDQHGGAEAYLKGGGLTDDELAALKARLRG